MQRRHHSPERYDITQPATYPCQTDARLHTHLGLGCDAPRPVERPEALFQKGPQRRVSRPRCGFSRVADTCQRIRGATVTPGGPATHTPLCLLAFGGTASRCTNVYFATHISSHFVLASRTGKGASFLSGHAIQVIGYNNDAGWWLCRCVGTGQASAAHLMWLRTDGVIDR